MKKLFSRPYFKTFNIFFAVFFFSVFIFSCKSVTKSKKETVSVKIKSKPYYGYVQETPKIPVNEYLIGKAWRLAGCKFEDEFKIFDANLDMGRIIFFESDKFEATSGIKDYYGLWKVTKRLNENKYKIWFKISKLKIIDEGNTIGKPYDIAFHQNLQRAYILEIDQYSIRLYSKDEDLILHFVKR